MNVKLSIPEHFKPEKTGEVWRVPYQQLAADAEQWRRAHKLKPAAQDAFRVCLLLVDVQNTFCIPDFELFVTGRSGTGAVEDNQRLCRFIYENLGTISQICPTMDTHQVMQIFHSIFLVNEQGEHPAPFSLISAEDINHGTWKFNPELCKSLDTDAEKVNTYLRHYAAQLKNSGKYDLTIWPYHAMLGGIGHALVSAVEEAVFFHSIARLSQPDFQVKGDNPLTENYSVLSPEVLKDQNGHCVAQRNNSLVLKLLDFDAVIIAGQAKSHCVASSIDDLLKSIHQSDPAMAERVYLLEDCMSPVVIPGVIDYTDAANEAFERFAKAGMHIVQSTTPMQDWPGTIQAMQEI